MNYYNEIKHKLIRNEIYSKVKDYSKNRNELNTYYEVGKILNEAGKHYGKGIIKEYSLKLTNELDKKYNETNLKRMRQFYRVIEKGATLWHQLSWSHYKLLIVMSSIDEINYYAQSATENFYSVRQLHEKIKNKEYERLDYKVKDKLITREESNVEDFIKNPIIIKNKMNYIDISEKTLKQLILEDLDSFMKELGEEFSYVGNEYKIKIGDRYNYIDLLFYNIRFNCYIVIELKVTELKKEYIGQIEVYMNYIDNNLRKINQDKTIGIIICRKDNKFIMEYCSDERIISREYFLI